MGGIGVVHNPFARKNLKQPLLGKKLSGLLEGCDQFYETQRVDELESVAQSFREKGLEILAVNGGDGTLHKVLTAFVHVYKDNPLPTLVILRGGTMNTVSNSLKLKGNPEIILKKVLAVRRQKGRYDLIRQPMLKANSVYGFMSGAGVISGFLDRYYTGSGTGPLKAFSMVALMIASAVFQSHYIKDMFRDEPMRIDIDGRDPGKEHYTTVYASTVREVGLGFKLTHRACDKEGCFHFIATSIPPLALIQKLWHLWAGKDIRHPEMYHNGPAAIVEIRPVGNLRWMVDGDMYGTDETLRISAGPVVDIIKV